MKLADYIKVYDDVASKDWCDNIIAQSEQAGFSLFESDNYKFLQLNLNESSMVGDANKFATDMAAIAKAYFKEVGADDHIGIQAFEHVRIKKYIKGSDLEFREHIDALNKVSSVRYLIFILYLNDNDGETVFESLGVSVKPKQGRVVVFPPFWMFPHSGKTPTNNDKYILMTSLHFV